MSVHRYFSGVSAHAETAQGCLMALGPQCATRDQHQPGRKAQMQRGPIHEPSNR
uniref:hypothetical protein n=1 Tax=Aeromonas salmonicida TaxID=645 RepID=UPI00339690C1